jgi:hypothetical protein
MRVSDFASFLSMGIAMFLSVSSSRAVRFRDTPFKFHVVEYERKGRVVQARWPVHHLKMKMGRARVTVQSMAEAMYEELKPLGIQVQTINPGPYLTGFNETVVETGLRWLSDDVNFIKREAFQKVVDGLLGKPEGDSIQRT